MDVDFDNDPVDQNLLQLFSCMGTTDKDELVKQMQKLVGDNMNATTASFFLDMNNWNLQAAVCSYFDFESSFKLPSMSLVQDELSVDAPSLEYQPGSKFEKMWLIQNTGEESWPIGCHLQFAGGDLMTTLERIPVPALGAQATTVVAAHITAPTTPGIYQSKFRMATPTGAYFGDIIWMIVNVCEETMTNELTQQFSHLNALGGPIQPLSENTIINNPFSVTVPSNTHLHFQDSVQPESNDNKMC